tara:strand:+ start:5326 stop:6414 length:1089 start_codon:yes stop_codon:yes gene_type:complete
MGAINKDTSSYVYPTIASKNDKYKCPTCNIDVIFKKGKIKRPHFCHTISNVPCYYYNRPGESEIHKDAKLLLKTLFDNNTEITFYRNCSCCKDNINIITLNNNVYINTTSTIEYRFCHDNKRKIADVVLIENNRYKYIFEICYTHKTKEEDRPEPWFELDAVNLINNVNLAKLNNISIKIECIREYKCNKCIKSKYERFIRKELENTIYIQLNELNHQYYVKKYANIYIKWICKKAITRLGIIKDRELRRIKKREILKLEYNRHNMENEDSRTIINNYTRKYITIAKTNIINIHIYKRDCELKLFLKKEEEIKEEKYNKIRICSIDEVKEQIALFQKNKRFVKSNNVNKESYKISKFFLVNQ